MKKINVVLLIAILVSVLGTLNVAAINQENLPFHELEYRLNMIKVEKLDRFIFDANIYRRNWSSSLIGLSDEFLIRHWLYTGLTEEKKCSHIFDVKFYLFNNADLKNAFAPGIPYWQTSASKDSYGRAYMHFKKYGIDEGRQASSDFCPKAYINRYSDLKKEFEGPWKRKWYKVYEHYLKHGIREGRSGKPN